jgi:hypothetical protein
MPSQQLRKTMEGRQVSPLEYDNVLGHMEGTVNKEEVMNTISKNKTQFEDVVLGETTKGKYGEDEMLIPHYESYSEPGYVPGSYRERFVTAPNTRLNEVRQSLKDADILGLSAYERAQLTKESVLGKTWQDGHPAYSNIKNPVVRIRYNVRNIYKTKLEEDIISDKFKKGELSSEEYTNRIMQPKRILFIEEIQGPSSTEQAKMPEFLRKRIYDIGVKKALMLAKEGGYDGVAWTTGEMQASRYDLSKQVNKISWNRLTPTGIKDLFIDIKGHGTTHVQYDPINNIITAPNGGSTVFGTKVKLEDVVGKNIAEQIVSNNVGNISGLDLKVGGEGLKYLYDKQLPSLFKKYGKEGVESITLPGTKQTVLSAEDIARFDSPERRRILEGKDLDVHYIPITKKTPSRHPVYSLIPPTLAGMAAMYRTGEGNAQ